MRQAAIVGAAVLALLGPARAQEYPASVTIASPSIATWVWGPFPAGEHAFVVTAYNAAGVESSYSNQATKTCVAVCDVTLTWLPPTLNEDGSPLTDLAGFRLYATNAPTATKPSPPESLSVGADDPTVYTIVQSRNRIALVAVGTAAPGTACDPTQSVLGKYVVPIEAVTIPGSVRPVVVLGTCS